MDFKLILSHIFNIKNIFLIKKIHVSSENLIFKVLNRHGISVVC